MMQITKELALAVVFGHIHYGEEGPAYCVHCKAEDKEPLDSENVSHKDDCIVMRAKLLLNREWNAVDGQLLVHIHNGPFCWGVYEGQYTLHKRLFRSARERECIAWAESNGYTVVKRVVK